MPKESWSLNSNCRIIQPNQHEDTYVQHYNRHQPLSPKSRQIPHGACSGVKQRWGCQEEAGPGHWASTGSEGSVTAWGTKHSRREEGGGCSKMQILKEE